MITYFKDKYNLIFGGFILSIMLVALLVRPLNSHWHKFIAGDGFGYYSYLPAKFIHGDPNYDFKWFNKVHNANYVYSTFPNPEQNLLVEYGNKRINKYYPGLAYLWFPFFAAAHLTAKAFNYPSDGFSQPYQLAIGLASLFYLFLGLIFLRKLLYKLYRSQFVATLIPIVIFYGTYLYYYGINLNSQSHVYSFSAIAMFLYYVHCFFNEERNKLSYLLLTLMCLVVAISIRPLTGLIVFAIPAFIPPQFFRARFKWGKLNLKDWGVVFFTIGIIVWFFSIMYKQTGSFMPYTYTDEKFYFGKNKFMDALFSYHMGLFIYVPLAFIALFGIPFLPKGKAILLPVLFFSVLFLYSAWWYWPITSRGIIDFYPLLAIFLAALVHQFRSSYWKTGLIFFLLVIACVFYLFKSMQMHRGILDEFLTYKEVFWRNFLRTDKANMYLVPPSSILAKEVHIQNFDSSTFFTNRSSTKSYNGRYSLLLNKEAAFVKVVEAKVPQLFHGESSKKIKLSFYSYFEPGVTSTHVFILFYDKDHQLLLEAPFYLNQDDILTAKWDYKEFGYEITNLDFFKDGRLDQIEFAIWNVEGKNNLYIDEVKTEYILTDKSFDIVK